MDVSEQINYYKDYLEQNNLHVEVGEFVELDFKSICLFNPELSELLLDQPEESLKVIHIALENLTDDKNSKVQVLINNLPKTCNIPLNEISDQLDRFLTFEGYVMKPTEVMLKCIKARFECGSCGNILSILMLGREFVVPKRCGCGRKSGFRLLNQDLIKFQRFELQECMDEAKSKVRKPTKKKVYIAESLTRKELNQKIQPGQKVLISGFLELEELPGKKFKRSNEFKTNIVANNIEVLDTGWNSIKLTKVDLKNIKEMSQRPDLLDEFVQSIAPSFEGYELVRKSLILQHVSGKRLFDENGNLEERGTIHVLLSGAPSAGKSYLGKRSLKISPLRDWVQGAGLTKVGLVACISKDEYGSYTLEVGPLVIADGGSCMIDELDKLPKEHFGMLNNSMNDEETKITKANINQVLRTRTSVLATSNPKHKTFTDQETIIKQLGPIPKDILDRFDVIWAMREKVDQDKLDDKYNARHLGGSQIKQLWSNKDMTNYISYARKLIPIITPEIAKYYNEKFKKLTGKTVKSDDSEDTQSNRLKGNVWRWIYAHSKFVGVMKENNRNEVEVLKESVDFAFGMMRYSFEMLNLLSEDGFVKYEDVEDVPSKKEVNKYYVVRGCLKDLVKEYKNMVPEEKLMDIVMKKIDNFDIDSLYVELDKLKKAGDLFEPRRGFYGLL